MNGGGAGHDSDEDNPKRLVIVSGFPMDSPEATILARLESFIDPRKQLTPLEKGYSATIDKTRNYDLGQSHIHI